MLILKILLGGWGVIALLLFGGLGVLYWTTEAKPRDFAFLFFMCFNWPYFLIKWVVDDYQESKKQNGKM